MDVNNSKTKRYLLLCTSVSVVLLTLRVFLNQHFIYSFLLWNLFLAYLPWFFAQKTVESDGITSRYWLYLLLWLVFWPNAPYLITDLVHLKRESPTFWLDLSMFSSFAIQGCIYGYLSYVQVQRSLQVRHPMIGNYLLPVTALPMAAFGIYLGRVVRLNSWDLIIHPLDSIRLILDYSLYAEDKLFVVIFMVSIGLFLYLLYNAFSLLSNVSYLHK